MVKIGIFENSSNVRSKMRNVTASGNPKASQLQTNRETNEKSYRPREEQYGLV